MPSLFATLFLVIGSVFQLSSCPDFEKDVTPEINLSIGELKHGQIHIGQGVFIDKLSFDDCFNKKKPAMFVKTLATCVFGNQTLRNSSVTGKPTNKNVIAKPKLDATKLRAITSAFQYYLEAKGTTENRLHEELKMAATYIASKINNLSRKSRAGLNKSTPEGAEENNKENLEVSEIPKTNLDQDVDALSEHEDN